MSLKIFPAIDLRKGHVVQLVGGDPDQVAVQAAHSPRQQAAHWKSLGAKRLHVVDLDAALGGPSQWGYLGGILKEGLPTQFGGGVREMTQVAQLRNMGVEGVIVGTRALREPEWLHWTADMLPNQLIVSVDSKGYDVMVSGWKEPLGKYVRDVAKDISSQKIRGILYTNVAKEGRLEGIDLDCVQAVVEAAGDVPVQISGGITSIEDLQEIEEVGADGVVLGMSIYKDVLHLDELVRRFEA